MSVRLLHGDCRAILPTLPAESVQCVVTSPPYWGLRDYGVEGQLGLEPTPEAYVEQMVGVFRAVRRVLRDDGTLWLNMGDSYSSLGWKAGGDIGVGSAGPYIRSDYVVRKGSPRSNWQSAPVAMAGGRGKRGKSCTARPTDLSENTWQLKVKDLVGMPWRLAFALQADGWYLRADIIWAKPNPMPESVTDRPTKAHEYVFLLTKAARYFYDADAVREASTERPSGNGHSRPNPAAILGRGDTRHAIPYEPNGTGRNLRSVWTINPEPFPGSHFATFPTALAARCIRAGTSERGACGACGAPWARVVEIHKLPSTKPNSQPSRIGDARRDPASRTDLPTGLRYDKHVETTGWQPSCACDAPVVPCTVLDPFGGSGTVGAVAEQHGRHSILIELAPAYVTMAEERTAQYGLFTAAGVEA